MCGLPWVQRVDSAHHMLVSQKTRTLGLLAPGPGLSNSMDGHGRYESSVATLVSVL